MYLEFFVVTNKGYPLIEPYRLVTDTFEEIRATILYAPYNLCLDALDASLFDEYKTLEEKISLADANKTKIAMSTIARHADIKARIAAASAWLNDDVAVFLCSKETNDSEKELLWKGKLMKCFEHFEHVSRAVIKLQASDKLTKTIHSIESESDAEAEKKQIAANLATALKSVPRLPVVDAVISDKIAVSGEEKIDLSDLDVAIKKLDVVAGKQKKVKQWTPADMSKLP
jgi:hypothetical protein